jgi:hypothetical protein
MVNLQENQYKSIVYIIAYILGRSVECPDPVYLTSLNASFPQQYPQVWWKSLTVLGMAF